MAVGDIISNLRGLVGSILRIGLEGASSIQLKNSAGVAEVRNDDDTGYADLTTGSILGTKRLGLTGVISPTALAIDQNDYNPTDLSLVTAIRQDLSASVFITGLAGGATGRVIILHNISSTFNLTLVSESASSTAANRFALVSNVILPPTSTVFLRYDSTSSRWRLVASGSAVANGTGKTRFTPFSGNATTARGDHPTIAQGANASSFFEVNIPNDFTQLISAQVVGIPNATGMLDFITLNTTYGAIGEQFNAHTGTTVLIPSVTDGQFFGLDMSTVITSAAPADHIGVEVDHDSVGQTVNYIGILLVYL